MIKHGVSVLKKLKYFFSILLVLCAASCKSVPEESKSNVKAIDLLDANSTFYISIPKSVDEELVSRIIKSNVKQLSEDDIKALTQRIKRLYIGISRKNYQNNLQASINSDVPVKYVPRLLSSKNGWEKSGYKATESKTEYDIYTQNKLDICFPSSDIILLGRDVKRMINNYDIIYNSPEEETKDGYYSDLDKDIYNWLDGSDEEIRFYTVQPSIYLSVLVGSNLNLQLLSVWGSFKPSKENKDVYYLDLTFNFKNETYKKASKTILMIAFGLTDADTTSDSPTILKISGIELNKQQIYKLLVL